MDIQLFATDEELQDFPEAKTDSTVPDKTPKSNSINLAASDLPRSHSHLPRIPSRLPERKIRHQSRRDHRRKSRSNTRPKPTIEFLFTFCYCINCIIINIVLFKFN